MKLGEQPPKSNLAEEMKWSIRNGTYLRTCSRKSWTTQLSKRRKEGERKTREPGEEAYKGVRDGSTFAIHYRCEHAQGYLLAARAVSGFPRWGRPSDQ